MYPTLDKFHHNSNTNISKLILINQFFLNRIILTSRIRYTASLNSYHILSPQPPPPPTRPNPTISTRNAIQWSNCIPPPINFTVTFALARLKYENRVNPRHRRTRVRVLPSNEPAPPPCVRACLSLVLARPGRLQPPPL